MFTSRYISLFFARPSYLSAPVLFQDELQQCLATWVASLFLPSRCSPCFLHPYKARTCPNMRLFTRRLSPRRPRRRSLPSRVLLGGFSETTHYGDKPSVFFTIWVRLRFDVCSLFSHYLLGWTVYPGVWRARSFAGTGYCGTWASYVYVSGAASFRYMYGPG